ncbi:hypothetical protein AWL63_18385 [Sphingomonas panacis]|uniref:HTH luxR-type domain-containing protein n=1 Tax=Sphingomonas panacis TaxID=1560345 RepID=A0A1B3ZDV5_9SPHN|nr:autoinducer binding domain-containing protein [Sphingomonas panacis]AOH85610.1 hypothetical protein AWL63_18385 [Sphingomonas panacis]
MAAMIHILETFCTMSGFRWFSLSHLGSPGEPTVKMVDVTNFPLAARETSLVHPLHLNNPMAMAVANCATSVSWSDIPKRVRLTDQHVRLLELLSVHGLRYGVTVAVRIPGDRGGLVNFASDDPSAALDEGRYAAELLAPHAFEAVRRIAGLVPPTNHASNLPLTGRQTECLMLVAQGKSDWEAGRILGLSDQTVHDHVETVRRRYGVRRRTQLVVQTLYDGHLSFHDVL